MYNYGYGVPKNLDVAIEWYTKAASQGHILAQRTLGWVYQFRGEVKDLQKAVNWYQVAFDNGDKELVILLKMLNDQGYYSNREQRGNNKYYVLIFQLVQIIVNILTEELYVQTITNDNSHSSINNQQVLSFPTASNDEEYFNKLVDEKMKSLEHTFEIKMSMMETKYEQNKEREDALHRRNDVLEQEQAQKDEEKKQLKERLAQLEAEMNGTNDSCYDSSDNESDNLNDINYDSENDCSEGESNQIGTSDINHSALNYNDNGPFADFNYVLDTNTYSINYHSDDSHAEPNYNSSDNENYKKYFSHKQCAF
jgi:hypothetical protein